MLQKRTGSAFEFFGALQGLRMRSCLSFLSLPITTAFSYSIMVVARPLQIQELDREVSMVLSSD